MDAVQASPIWPPRTSTRLCRDGRPLLYGYALKYNPDKTALVSIAISSSSRAGHGSMFLYAWLHMSGYDLPMSEIKRFRQTAFQTPGHPEFGHTTGVECHDGALSVRGSATR